MDDDVRELPRDPDLVPLDVPDAPAGEAPPSPQAARRHRLWTVAAIAIGGCVGAVARYAVGQGLPTPAKGFPWATFVVNVSGSAALCCLLVVVVERLPRGHLARPLLGTGLIGAYTTFSTFSVEAVLLVRHGASPEAVLYVLTSLVAGLGAGFLGIVAARLTLTPRRAAEEEA